MNTPIPIPILMVMDTSVLHVHFCTIAILENITIRDIARLYYTDSQCDNVKESIENWSGRCRWPRPHLGKISRSLVSYGLLNLINCILPADKVNWPP